MQDFIRLNKQWIETWFRLEQTDIDTFAHIGDYIIGLGGDHGVDAAHLVADLPTRLKDEIGCKFC